MKRFDTPELLDSDACSPEDVQTSLRDIGRMNRWFGGVSTTQKLIEQVARVTGLRHFSLLEVAAGTGEVSHIVREKLVQRGIALDVTLLDRAWSHLPKRGSAIVADASHFPSSTLPLTWSAAIYSLIILRRTPWRDSQARLSG